MDGAARNWRRASASDGRLTPGHRAWVGLLERLVLRDVGRSARFVATVAGFGIALLLAAFDYATGFALSFDAFYVLLVVVMTVVGRFVVGLSAAAVTAVVWTSSDVLIRELRLGTWPAMWNGAIRFAALGIVVLLVTALVSTLTEARNSERGSREFLAVAAHQLRTPVAALRASVEGIVHAPPGAAQERLVSNAMTESARLGRLISSLLKVARLDQGEPPDLRRVEIRPLVAAEVERMRELAPVDFELTVADDVPSHVDIDAAGTCDALANLLDNARRHAARRVVVEVVMRGGWVAVAVVDDGPGLPAGSEEAAFGRFVTLDGGGGSGLGLPIARSLARQQGGDLRYHAKRFVLLIPAPIRRAAGVDGVEPEDQRGGPST